MSGDESMSARVVVRDEGSEDHADIHEVTRLAFIGQPYSDGDEPELIDRLRAEGALKLSPVAMDGDVLVGQITFHWLGSRQKMGPCMRWYRYLSYRPGRVRASVRDSSNWD